jgi:uncharacterized protein (DUF2126 family)
MHTELDSNKKNYRKLIFCNKYLIPMLSPKRKHAQVAQLRVCDNPPISAMYPSGKSTKFED